MSAASGVASGQPLSYTDREDLLNDQSASQAAETMHTDPAESIEPDTSGRVGSAQAEPDIQPDLLVTFSELAESEAETSATPEPVEVASFGIATIEVAPESQISDPALTDHDAPVDDAAPAEAEILFSDLGLSEPILRAIEEKGYRHPTPIQAQAIPAVLSGRDVMGVAQTGTGKTAGFTLPMLDILSGSRARARMPRSLILEPTRELALQVAENFVAYGKYLKLTHALLIGGESVNDQKEALMKGVDVLIATPGRLIDLFERGGMMLTDAKLLVIDEADRMLDMGFIPDVERIVAMLPKTRQTLFFSATMAPEIRRLSDAFLSNPRLITVSKSASVATTIVAGLALVAEQDKREALRRLIRSEDVQNALIFCNRKIEVDILYKSLVKHGFSAGALHGDMSQPARFATLEKFKRNELRLLVCSDVAARGIDIGGLSHVFNFDVPHHAEDYVHRIGRTGRAGLKGHAFTLATPEDRMAVEAIEKLTGAPIPPMVVEGLDVVAWAEDDGRKRRGRGGRPAPRGDRKPSRAAEQAPPQAEAVPAAAAAAAADEKPARGRSRGGKGRGRRDETRPPRSEPAASPQAARTQEPREAERPAPRLPEPPRLAEPARAMEPARDFSRDRPREYRRREEDLGPQVLAFGEETPAFMLLPTRRGRADFVAIDFTVAAEPEAPSVEEFAEENAPVTFVEAPEALENGDQDQD